MAQSQLVVVPKKNDMLAAVLYVQSNHIETPGTDQNLQLPNE